MSGHRRQSKTQPTITVFAGPNGSGKTTLTNQFALEGCIDNLVNADQMAAMLASEEGLSTPTLQQQHQAAHAAEALRWEMIKNKESFTTETVMSDSARWQKFFESARQQGYRLKLIFITTRDPAINVLVSPSGSNKAAMPWTPKKSFRATKKPTNSSPRPST